jgi:hypothetical protein
MAKNIENAILKAPSPPPPELVWRGVTGDGAQAYFSKLHAGDVVQLAGFQSTTIRPEFIHSYSNVFEIKPKAGAYVRPISDHKSEYEFLLQHNAKYVVHGAAKVMVGGHQKTVMQLEML